MQITFIQNGIKKEINNSYLNECERSLMCKKTVETLLYKLNYDYRFYNNTLISFNHVLHLLNTLPFNVILNKIILSQPVNNHKTCFLHMLYNKNNHFTIIIEQCDLNKVLEIVFYTQIIHIPLIN